MRLDKEQPDPTPPGKQIVELFYLSQYAALVLYKAIITLQGMMMVHSTAPLIHQPGGLVLLE